MKIAADFRLLARNALRGKWTIAVITGLIAMMLGATGSTGPEVNFKFDGHHSNLSIDYSGATIFSTQGGVAPELQALLLGGAFYIGLAAIVFGVLYFVLSSVVGVGYARFNLELIDGEEASIGSLFTYFSYWKNTAMAKLLQAVYILLWSLLLIIPGIMASYSYAMTKYILAEQPELTAKEALALSKKMMYGNRWRLLCLQVSFIGWALASALTMGIGVLWLVPYMETATAAFYREITGTWSSEPVKEKGEVIDVDDDEYYYSEEK